MYLMKMMVTCFSVMIMTLLLSFSTTALKAQAKSKPWIAPAVAIQVKNPYSGDVSAAKEGKKLYITYCSPCHGNSGKGDGLAAASVNPKPADHTSDAVQHETDGSLFWKMTEGRGPMVSYKQILTEQQRWQLVTFIKTLGKKK